MMYYDLSLYSWFIDELFEIEYSRHHEFSIGYVLDSFEVYNEMIQSSTSKQWIAQTDKVLCTEFTKVSAANYNKIKNRLNGNSILKRSFDDAKHDRKGKKNKLNLV